MWIRRYTCPCCGARSLEELRQFDVCPICYWEDDNLQRSQPDYAGGANRFSLIEARQNVLDFGVSDPKLQPSREKEEKCPCCGARSLDEVGSYDICPFCFWEDDPDQREDPTFVSGANGISLEEGRRNVADFGACTREMLPYVKWRNRGED